MEIKCTKCKQSKPISCFFEKKTENRFSSLCKNCLYDNQKTRWTNRKIEAIKIFGGKCSICGYCKNYAALEFHHQNHFEKDFDWRKMKLRAWEDIINELKKCTLVCANCHREIHNPQAELDLNCISNQSLNATISSSGNCPICNIAVYNTKYCSRQCAAEGRQKVKRPSKEELSILLKNTNWCEIGRMFGVSDNSVRKWAKQYNL